MKDLPSKSIQTSQLRGCAALSFTAGCENGGHTTIAAERPARLATGPKRQKQPVNSVSSYGRPLNAARLVTGPERQKQPVNSVSSYGRRLSAARLATGPERQKQPVNSVSSYGRRLSAARLATGPERQKQPVNSVSSYGRPLSAARLATGPKRQKQSVNSVSNAAITEKCQVGGYLVFEWPRLKINDSFLVRYVRYHWGFSIPAFLKGR